MSHIFDVFMPADIFYFAASEGDFVSTSCKVHESFPLFLFLFLSNHILSVTLSSVICRPTWYLLEKSSKCSIPCLSSLYFPVFLCMSPWKSKPFLSSPDGTWYTWKGRKNQQGLIITSPFTIIYYFSYLDING